MPVVSSLSLHLVQPRAWRATTLALLAATCLAGAAQAAPVVLNPLYTGAVATSDGAQADFRRIDNAWHGSQVLWNEQTKTYGNGQPIGSFGWGTGLWGRADWQQVMTGQVTPVASWSGSVETINFANARYNECYSGTWGAATLVPGFANVSSGVACSDAEAGSPDQQNWVSHFTGLIRITDPGLYNFSVLYDDGFFFRLVGAGSQALEIDQDFLNPRNREGFADNLQLAEGLYGFELGSWNRLGAGVVDLRWSRGDANWTLVPTSNLARLTDQPLLPPTLEVPEPPLPALLLLAVPMAWAARRWRKPA